MYLDSFLTIAGIDAQGLTPAIEKLDIISEKFGIKFVLSIASDPKVLPECAKARLVVAL